MDDEQTKSEPATISAPPAPPITLDPQNPLPEKSMFWRRIFTAAITANALVFAWFMAKWFHAGGEWDKLYGLTKIVLYGDGFVLLFYFLAPSASELTNMIATASIWKKSIVAQTETAKHAENRPQTALAGDSRHPASPDSGFPPPTPDAAPGAPADEIDAAPRGAQ